MKTMRYISFILIAVSASLSFGQTWTWQANDFYKAQNYEQAKIAIDSAIGTAERYDSQTWQLRGLIYRNLEGSNQLYYSQIAIESFVRAKKVDSTNIYTAKINEYIKNTLIKNYYNVAVQLLLEDKNFEKSEEFYTIYKKNYLALIDPMYSFKSSDVDYYNTVAVQYITKVDFAEPPKKSSLREKAIENCAKVLAIDSLDYKANFNMGIIYYNLGADYIMIADPEITMEQLMENQKRAENAFLKALPLLNNADRIQPGTMEVYEGLMGCYYGLNNDDLYLKYQILVDKHYLPVYLEQFKNQQKDIKNIKTLSRIYTYTLVNEEEANRLRTIINELQNE